MTNFSEIREIVVNFQGIKTKLEDRISKLKNQNMQLADNNLALEMAFQMERQKNRR